MKVTVLWLLLILLPAGVDGRTLRVGTSGDYPPFSCRDAQQRLEGFDVAVADRLSRDLGRQVEWVIFRWPDLLPDARRGAFDIVMSGVTVRTDRMPELVFTRPYATTGAVAVIRADSVDRLGSLETVDRGGVRIAVNRGGHLERVARQRFRQAEIVAVSDNTTLPDLLERGDADAVISEQFEARSWGIEPGRILGPFTRDRKAYAIPRGGPALLPAVDDWLALREADGWLNQQRQRWLGPEAVSSPEQTCLDAVVAAIDVRFQLMPLVAAAKRRQGLPIDDPAQETRVIEQVRRESTAAGLDPASIVPLFEALIDIAKALQRDSLAGGVVTPGPPLEDLRAAIATTSTQLLAELARCRQWTAPAGSSALERALRDGLTTPSLPPSALARIVESLRQIRYTDRKGR